MQQHEPRSALDGGDGHGTESLDQVCIGAVRMLRPGGFLALETAGGTQASAVADSLAALRDAPSPKTLATAVDSQAGSLERLQAADGRTPGPVFTRVEVVKDTCGVQRFVTAWRA